MRKRHEIEILLKAGHRKTEVARLAGVSLCSVKPIARERPVLQVDDEAECRKRQIGRPSTVTNFLKQVVGILQEEPDLATLEILRRVREAGYQGGKTVFYALVASLRPKLAKPLVRFEGLPGEFSQHDFGQVKVGFLNGTCQQIHFFASRLKYSRCMRVSLVKDERVESLASERCARSCQGTDPGYCMSTMSSAAAKTCSSWPAPGISRESLQSGRRAVTWRPTTAPAG